MLVKQLSEKVAKALDLTFNDSDKLVEEKVGLTVKEIFDVHGEIYFRGLEEAMILSCLSEDQPQVLALGGGAFINDRIREVCIEKGDAIFLKISWEEWKKRADDLRPTRPLLQKIVKMKFIHYSKRDSNYIPKHPQQ